MLNRHCGQRTRIKILLGFLLMAYSQSTASTRPQNPHDASARLFAYDRSRPFDLKEESSKELHGVTIRDVNYAAYTPQRGRIKAYLIAPAQRGTHAGVVFFHWYGRPNGDRNQFVDEAVTLAKRGTVSLLIQGYFPWSQEPTNGQADRQRVIDETIEVRRALDLLLSQTGVDSRRIGFVGHDYGAMYGAIVAGVDRRVKAYILIAGVGSFSRWSLDYWLTKAPERSKETYRMMMKTVDPIIHITRAKGVNMLFQFANSDEHITRAEAIAFYDAAGQPKEIKWYDAKHELKVDAARNDRREWLTRQLGLVQPN